MDFFAPCEAVHHLHLFELIARDVEPCPFHIFVVRRPTDGRFLALGAAVHAVHDPLEDAHVFAEADPEAGRGAVGVRQHLAALEPVGLLEIVGRHLAAEVPEAVGDGRLDRPVENELLAQHPGHGLAGAVVAGRAEPAGGDDHVGARPARAQLRGDGRRLVGDRHVARQLHAAAAELLADPGQVPVGGEPEQQLVAQGQQLKAPRGPGAARTRGRRQGGNGRSAP